MSHNLPLSGGAGRLEASATLWDALRMAEKLAFFSGSAASLAYDGAASHQWQWLRHLRDLVVQKHMRAILQEMLARVARSWQGRSGQARLHKQACIA